MMLNNVLYGLNGVVYLLLAGLFIFFSFRTRSRGLMFLTAVLLLSGLFNALIEQGVHAYIDGRITDNTMGQGPTLGEFTLRIALLKPLLYNCLYLIGGFLVYREWRLGKFHNPHADPLEER